MEKNKKQNKKVQFVVVREFSGDKTMREAFEQLIERQTCEHFEEWLEVYKRQGMVRASGNGTKSGVKQLNHGQGHGIIMVSCPCS